MPEPEELTQGPYHDEELNRNSYLGPAFSSHRDILAELARLGDKSPLADCAGFEGATIQAREPDPGWCIRRIMLRIS
jgi:hypothetical protein